MKKINLTKFVAAAIFAVIATMAFCVNPVLGAAILAIPGAGVMSVKTVNVLTEQRGGLITQLDELVKKAEGEKRDINDDENVIIDRINGEIQALNTEIERRTKLEANLAIAAGDYINKRNQEIEDKELKQFSWSKFLQGAMRNELSGFEKEMHIEAEREARESGVILSGFGIPSKVLGTGANAVRRMMERRDLTAGSATNMGDLINPYPMTFIDSLVAKLVMVDLGAIFMNGLVGDVPMNRLTTGSSAAWEGEVDAGAEQNPGIVNTKMTPHRLGAYAQLSKQLIFQTSGVAQTIVQNDIQRAIRVALEAAAINGGSGSEPDGILSTTGIGSIVGGQNGLAPTWAHITGLETEVAIDNADVGTLAYLTNPKAKGKLKNTLVSSTTGVSSTMIWGTNDNTVNGYRAAVTTNVPSNLDKGTSTGVCSAIIFGNFNDLVIGNWAGLDITVDPYTDAKNALVNVIVNSWWDVFLRNPASFSAMKDALTT
jgi:HK97 family phage major capsid protein